MSEYKLDNFQILGGNKYGGIAIDGSEGDRHIDWYYPSIYEHKGEHSHLIIDLVHTRAADAIRICYDSDRDGWIVEQASIFEWEDDDEVCDEGWIEVAFIRAWALATKNE